MANKGLKIADLAKSLGVTTRTLIECCRANGLTIQNGITKVPPHTEREIRSWFTSGESKTTAVQ